MLLLQYLLTNGCDHASGMLEIYEGKSKFWSGAEPQAESLKKSLKALGLLRTSSPEAT